VKLHLSTLKGSVNYGMIKYLEVGRIVNTHGVKGEVKVIPLTDNPKRFLNLKWVFIDKNMVLEKYNIEKVKFYKGMVLIKFKGINDMTDAEALKGMFLKVDRENAVRLPDDSFFICDIVGCEVFEEDGSRLGTLKDVLKTGSNDVYVILRENGKEIYLPALKSVVKSVSISNKKMIVSVPEGLLDEDDEI
jgi:16S rRNA processing protein RimM